VNSELRLSFRRIFSVEMMQVWGDLCVVMEQVNMNEDSNSLVWCYTKSGMCSSQSCYAVISF
jgi:hypothetical protein